MARAITEKEKIINGIPYIFLAIIGSSFVTISPEPGDNPIINFILGITIRTVVTMGLILSALFIARFGGKK